MPSARRYHELVATLDPVALDKLRKLGGDEFVSELVQTFLKDAPERVQAALEAGRRQDWEGVERATHSLASSAAMMGAGELHDLSRSIEHRAAEKEGDLMPELTRMEALYLEYARQLQALV